MQQTFYFPDVGEGIAEGEIVSWLIEEGDIVKEDQSIIEVETDKAVVSLPSPYSGKVIRREGQPGEIIQVGAALVTIETVEEQSPPRKKKKKDDAGSVVGVLKSSDEIFVLPDSKPPDATQPQMKVRAIPSVRKLAKELGVNLSHLQGSGRDGRITRQDVERAAVGQVDPPPVESSEKAMRETEVQSRLEKSSVLSLVERIPFRGVRRSAAHRVTESAQKVAAVTFCDDADITRLAKVRSDKKDLAEERGFKLTYLPFMIKAVIAGLKQYPYLNATLDEASDEIILKKYYNTGIAVDTPEGLMVFVIKQADEKSILDLAKEICQLTEKAFSRKIALSDLKGGSFTLTNYGVIGGKYGTPIINYPEVGILGLGKIEDRAVVKAGEIVIRKILPLSLTFDHRVIYGAEAARFMNTVIAHLEDPDLILIEGK